jgi:hypothetical protein
LRTSERRIPTVRIDLGRDVREQRGRCVDAEALRDRVALERVEREPMRKSQLAFFAHCSRMPGPARVVEAFGTFVRRAWNLARNFADVTDRRFARLEDGDGIRVSVLFRSRHEAGINFILQQRGARGRAAPARIALVEHGDIESRVLQLARDERARDARADYGDIAANVGRKRREFRDETVPDRPVRVAAIEIHALLRRVKFAHYSCRK